MNAATRLFCFAGLTLARQFLAAAQNSFTDAEAKGIKLFLHDNFRQTNACIVIGLVDKHGSRSFSAGKLDNGTDQEANGDTFFSSDQFPRRLLLCCSKTL